MITKALLYCTLNQPALFYSALDRKYMIGKDKPNDRFSNRLNGHVVAVFDIEVEEIKYLPYECTFYTDTLDTIVSSNAPISSFEKASCLSYFELEEYLNKYETDKACGYAIHIKNLKVFDEPHKLGETFDIKYTTIYESVSLPKKAPQNMQRVYVDMTIGDFVEPVRNYVLISIQPQWLVKILNGEKTIEVRKKVLKEMLK